jgi:tRNA(fMet)-specific endonuclease VapC
VDVDEHAAIEFQRLRNTKVRIKTMDLKIAAITLSLEATLLTRNSRDFIKVPGLRFEDWTKE